MFLDILRKCHRLRRHGKFTVTPQSALQQQRRRAGDSFVLLSSCLSVTIRSARLKAVSGPIPILYGIRESSGSDASLEL